VSSDLREIVDGIVAPLAGIAPAERGRGRDLRRRRLVVLLAASVAFLLLAVAAAWTVMELTAEPAPTPVSPSGRLSCLDLVGGTAGHAENVLHDRGYTVEWSLLRYQPPDGRMFTQTAESSVAKTAIVEDVEQGDGNAVTVFVHAADDAYAPTPKPFPCPQ
jgi:hypothetical protein